MSTHTPDPRDDTDRRPVVIVVPMPTSLAAATTTAELAGLTVVDGWAVDDGPWDLSHTRVVVRGLVGEGSTESELIDVVVRGAGAIVGIDPRPAGDARLLDALRRTAPLLDWRDCPLMTLDVEQLRLLHALAGGHTARAAARTLHVSERTAHRRIADARIALAGSDDEPRRGRSRGCGSRVVPDRAMTQVSTSSVTGPSLTNSTAMSAPKLPVATVAPSARSRSTTRSTSGSACSGRAAST